MEGKSGLTPTKQRGGGGGGGERAEGKSLSHHDGGRGPFFVEVVLTQDS